MRGTSASTLGSDPLSSALAESVCHGAGTEELSVPGAPQGGSFSSSLLPVSFSSGCPVWSPGQLSFPPDPPHSRRRPDTWCSVWVHWLRGNIWWVYLCWTVGVYGQFVTLKCINCFLTSIQPLVMPAGATGPGTWLLIRALVQQPESAKFPFLSVQKRRKGKKDLKMLE